jgi:hypothetical protein
LIYRGDRRAGEDAATRYKYEPLWQSRFDAPTARGFLFYTTSSPPDRRASADISIAPEIPKAPATLSVSRSVKLPNGINDQKFLKRTKALALKSIKLGR